MNKTVKTGAFSTPFDTIRQNTTSNKLDFKNHNCYNKYRSKKTQKGVVMAKRRILSQLLLIAGTITLLAGCVDSNTSKKSADSEVHEAITMQSPFRNMSAFIEVVHEQYPEINIEVIPYSGQNYTAYVTAQLETGDMPDLYCTTYYTPGSQKVDDKLIDMSGYAFTDCYAEARLREVTDNGAIYMLPAYFDCMGITYNKTLLEKHGWELPTSLRELEALAPEVEAAGCQLALDQIQLPGCGFQYFCSIMSTNYLNTPDGRKWQSRFLNGDTTMAENEELMKNLKILDRLREVGMLNGNGDPLSDDATRLEMAEGNTLFMLGNANIFDETETEDEFGIMPFLSEDGTQNAFILNVSRYMGLNKHLEDKGNEQKLEDAIHVMEVLSTVKGMKALNMTHANTSLLPLKDYVMESEGYYAEIAEDINAGMAAPFLYDGWENIIVETGNTMISYICGDATLQDVVHAFDDHQGLIEDNSTASYTTVTKKLNTSECARAVGICFAQASGADLALISKNKWYALADYKDLNFEGVSGELYPLPVTDQGITSILPTGWVGNIETVTLSGAQIRELVEKGYDRNGDGKTFPYELVTPEGFAIDDDTIYTVAICGVTESVAAEGNLTDTGILGLEAARKYFGSFDTFSAEDLIWE